jgi:hypothetical protein
VGPLCNSMNDSLLISCFEYLLIELNAMFGKGGIMMMFRCKLNAKKHLPEKQSSQTTMAYLFTFLLGTAVGVYIGHNYDVVKGYKAATGEEFDNFFQKIQRKTKAIEKESRRD